MIDNSMLEKLTKSGIAATGFNAPNANRETLLAALKIERRAGAIAIIKRELFKYLRPGDIVFAGSSGTPQQVKEFTASGKTVHLENLSGCWSWKDIEFLKPEKTGK